MRRTELLLLLHPPFDLSGDAPALNSNADFTRTLLAARAVSGNPELEEFIGSYSDFDLANAYMYFGPAATA